MVKNISLSRRRLTQATLLAGTTGALASFATPAQANNKTYDYTTMRATDETIAWLPGKPDINPGLAVTQSGPNSPAKGAPIAVVYSMGISPRLHIINLNNGKIEKVEEPYTNDYEASYGHITYPENRSTILVTSSGLLIHTNPDNFKTVVYKRSFAQGRDRGTVTGQLSTIAIGSKAGADNPGGLSKTYIGDYDGRLSRIYLPANQNPSVNPWYSYGQPFGGTVDIRSCAFIGGHLYVGVVGTEEAGIYRIPESTLDQAVKENRALTAQDFTKLNLPYPVGPVKTPKQLLLIQMEGYADQGKNWLVARLDGGSTIRLDVSNPVGNTATIVGEPFIVNQWFMIERNVLFTREKVGNRGFAVVGYNLRLSKPVESPNKFRSKPQLGSLTPGAPIVRVNGRASLLTYWIDTIATVPIDKPSVTTDEAPEATIVTQDIVPAERIQHAHLAYGNYRGKEFLAFAPRWVNNYDVGVVENPSSVKAGRNNSYVREQSNAGRYAHDSNQVESLSFRNSRLIIGTYPNGGAQTLNAYNYGGDAMTSEKLLGVHRGDPASSRYSSQTALPGGVTAFGVIGKFGSNGGGLALYQSSGATARSRQSLKIFKNEEVVPGQNITSVAYTQGHLLAGSSVRLENSATSARIEPAHDAKLLAIPYVKGDLKMGEKKEIPLPAGVKVVWSLLPTSGGRLFAIVQYDSKTIFQAPDGRKHGDVNALIELNPKTFQVIPGGQNGKGVYIYPTDRRYFNTNCQLLEAPNGQLIIRTNVQHHIATISPGKESKVAQAFNGGKPILGTSVAVGDDGTWYLGNFDGFVHRIKWA